MTIGTQLLAKFCYITMSQVLVTLTVKRQQTIWLCFVVYLSGVSGGYLHLISETPHEEIFTPYANEAGQTGFIVYNAAF